MSLGIIAVWRVSFSRSKLRRFTATPEIDAPAATLRGDLEAAFRVNPRLRGYVLDNRGHLRPNVVAFIDGRRSVDRAGQSDALAPDSEVHMLQALSGG